MQILDKLGDWLVNLAKALWCHYDHMPWHWYDPPEDPFDGSQNATCNYCGRTWKT